MRFLRIFENVFAGCQLYNFLFDHFDSLLLPFCQCQNEKCFLCVLRAFLSVGSLQVASNCSKSVFKKKNTKWMRETHN